MLKRKEAEEAAERKRLKLATEENKRKIAERDRQYRVDALVRRHLADFSRVGNKCKASYRAIKDACERVCRRMAEREARGDLMGDVTDKLIFEEIALSVDKFGE